MIKYNSLDKIIVHALCEFDEIDLFKIHYDYKLSPISILSSIDRLSRSGLIEIAADGHVRRADKFYELLVRERHQIYGREMPWKIARPAQNKRTRLTAIG